MTCAAFETRPLPGRKRWVFAEPDLIMSGVFRFRMKEIEYPPSTKLTYKVEAVVDPKPRV
jgi:hypothetical protein